MSVCPKCGSEMKIEYSREQRVGEDGELYIENMANSYCPNCDVIAVNADDVLTKEDMVKIIAKDLEPRLKTEYMKGVATGYITALNIVISETKDFTSAKKYHKYLINKQKEILETFNKNVNKSTEINETV